jgi:hypothetical protein
MYDISKEIEDVLGDFLQCDVVMYSGNKKFRSGKIKNFKLTDLYLQIILVCANKDKKIEVPIPFKVEKTEDTISFSYKMSDIGDFGASLHQKIKKYIGIPKSKLYNQVLTIRKPSINKE